MNLLPLEIVHRILAYDGRIKYRHGKYMNQIAQDDDRYEMLLTLPIIFPYPYHVQHGYLMILDTSNKIYCEKHIKFGLCEELSLIDTYSNTRYVQYIYNNQGFQYKLIIYKSPTPTPTFIESVIVYLYDLFRGPLRSVAFNN